MLNIKTELEVIEYLSKISSLDIDDEIDKIKKLSQYISKSDNNNIGEYINERRMHNIIMKYLLIKIKYTIKKMLW